MIKNTDLKNNKRAYQLPEVGKLVGLFLLYKIMIKCFFDVIIKTDNTLVQVLSF